MISIAAEINGIDLFIPKVYDIIWSLVVLVVLVVFFYKAFMPKFQKIFDERAEKIQGGIEHARKAQEEADAAKKSYEDQLSQARIDAAKIRDDARTQAKTIVADARIQADVAAAQITENAQRSIESQKKAALVSLKGEVGVVATALAGKILGSQLEDSKVQSSMIDAMLEQMDSPMTASDKD